MSDHAAIDRPGRTSAGSCDALPAQAVPARHRDRYAAVIAALIEVRPDEATARFDAEVAAAVADQRIDTQTARTLRWWQRASVRAAESYATTVVPGVLAVRDAADASAQRDAADAAASWRAALRLATPDIPVGDPVPASVLPAPEESTSDLASGGEPAGSELPITELAAVRLIAVPDQAPRADQPAPAQTAQSEQARLAIKAAFTRDVRRNADIPPSPLPTDLVATTVTTEREDRRHDDPATSA